MTVVIVTWASAFIIAAAVLCVIGVGAAVVWWRAGRK